MPIKKDDSGKRWVEMETVVPGSPEQVWQAIATGAGMTAWFTKATVEERVGGAIEFDFGALGTQAGEVTEWKPPHRLAYVERHWSEGAPPVATEITVTARSGGTCLMRMVHSLFSSSEDWDDQMEGFEKGWPGFFEVLRLYLTHFAGQPAASFAAMQALEGDHLQTWKRLVDRLDLAGVHVGEHRETAPDPEALSGVIERVQQDRQQRYVLMRLETPAPGIALVGTYDAGPQFYVSLNMYFYGDDAEARGAASAARWRTWLSTFAPEVAQPA